MRQFVCGFHQGALDDDAGCRVFPESNQEISRERDDRSLLQATSVTSQPGLEPQCKVRPRLVAYPKPSELDHGGSQPWIASFGHTLFAVDLATLPRRWR